MFPGFLFLLQPSHLTVELGGLKWSEVGDVTAGDTNSSRFQQLAGLGKMLRNDLTDDQIRDEDVSAVLSVLTEAANAGDYLDGVSPATLFMELLK